KVSTNGLLTFTTDATSLPTGPVDVLPNAAIPDKTVAIWGLSAPAVDDKIVVKTFGTAPNRQHWVMFANYNHTGGLPFCNIYWGIVMEETTNKIYLVDMRQSSAVACSPLITLGIQLDQDNAVTVNGSPSISNFAGSGTDASDNSYYEFVQGEQPKHDVMLIGLDIEETVSLGDAPLPVKVRMADLGAEAANSFDLHYSIDNGPTQTDHIVFPGFPSFTHGIPWEPTAAGTYTLRVWVDSPNGEADENPDNNEIVQDITVVAGFPDKLALLEHATQHNCPPCAFWNPIIKPIFDGNYHDVAVIKYHGWWPGANNDPMYFFNTADNQSRINYYGVSGVPTSVVQGNVHNGSPSGFTQAIIDQEAPKPGLVDIDITETISNGSLAVTISATPVVDLSGNNRLRVAITQDDVNYATATGTNGENEFPHVMRHMIPDGDGTAMNNTAGVATLAGSSYSIPGIFQGSVVRVIAFVQNDDDQSISMVAKSDGIFVCNGGGTMSYDIAVTEASCTAPDGTATITPAGGSGNYTYVWSTGGSMATASGLAAGDYVVNINDGAGCAVDVPVRIQQAEGPNVVLDATTTSCNGAADGKVDLFISGDASAYTYSWTGGATTQNLDNLPPASYTVTATDANGCTATASAIVTDAQPLAATGSSNPDNGTNNGSVTAVPTGGTPPYSYQWDASAGSATTATVDGLSMGTYDVTVTDYNGCTTDITVTVDSNVGLEEELAQAGISLMELFPNPTSGSFSLSLQMDQPEDLKLSLYDLSGRLVMAKTVENSLRYQGQFDLSGMASGVYMLHIQTSTGAAYKRIVRE
ncbi:MAG: T9SS type A sorting domain-containing protein, partial [Bacteroidota bacterium]